MKKIAFSFISLLFLAESPHAKEGKQPLDFDFVLMLSDCSLVAQTGKDLKTSKGDAHALFCEKKKKKYVCQMAFLNGENGHKGSEIIYDDNKDFTTHLLMNSNKGADFVYVYKTTHAASSISRVPSETNLAAKLCSGIYLTADEYEAMSKKSSATLQ